MEILISITLITVLCLLLLLPRLRTYCAGIGKLVVLFFAGAWLMARAKVKDLLGKRSPAVR